jgi:outer membrane protein insertion porin family
VRVDVDVAEVGGNLVDVKIDIAEGKRSKIRAINVVGNQRFDDRELLGELELKKTNWLSFYRSDDQYSKQSLEGDLEKIRSHYMDRGYADFEITSTQVALAPDKHEPVRHHQRVRGRNLDHRRREARRPLRGARGDPAPVPARAPG